MMNLLKRYWRKLFKKVTTKWEYLLSIMILLVLLIFGGITLYYYKDFTSQELLEDLKKAQEEATGKRSLKKGFYVVMVELFGKMGLYIFLIIGLYIVVKDVLFNIQKFLGKEVENEEEKEVENKE